MLKPLSFPLSLPHSLATLLTIIYIYISFPSHPSLPTNISKIISAYFQELCKNTCDNCRRGGYVEKVDYSDWARVAVSAVRQAKAQKLASLTLVMGAKLLMGSKDKSVAKYSGLNVPHATKPVLTREFAERMLMNLVAGGELISQSLVYFLLSPSIIYAMNCLIF